MTNLNQTSSDARRSVEVAEAIFECLSCGMDVPYTLLAEAEDLGLDVDAIKEKIEELYGSDEDDESLFD